MIAFEIILFFYLIFVLLFSFKTSEYNLVHIIKTDLYQDKQ